MEIFFRIVKSGCRVEAPQLAAVERLERALVIYLVIAWRILYLLVPLGRDCLSPALRGRFHRRGMARRLVDGQTPAPARSAPTLGEMIRLVASFGGFLGRKGDGHPDPKALSGRA